MGAAWLIVKEWSERQLGTQFPSLQALACYLVLNLSVSAGSTAAALITAVAENQLRGNYFYIDVVYALIVMKSKFSLLLR